MNRPDTDQTSQLGPDEQGALQKYTQLLHQVNQSLNMGGSLSEILQQLVDGIRAVLAFGNATCFLLNPEDNELTLSYMSADPNVVEKFENLIGFKVSGITIPLYEGSSFSKIISTKTGLVIHDRAESLIDFSTDESVRQATRKLAQMLGPQITYRVPLIVGDEVLGILGASRKTPDSQTTIDSDLAILEYMASKAAIIVKKAESDDSLRKSEQRYKLLLNLAPDSIVIMDGDGRITEVNEALLSKTGFEQSDLIGRHYSKAPFLPKVEFSKTVQLFKKLTDTYFGQPYEMRWKRKTGKKYMVEARVSIIKEGEKTLGYQAVARDVTHRRQLEKELKQKNKQLISKNIALKEMLSQLESEKSLIQSQITENVNRLVVPILQDLKATLSDSQSNRCDLMLERISDIVSPFSYNLGLSANNLTNKELEICDLIKRGYSSKDIGRYMNISFRTVETHRNSIRKKLKINNADVNLQVYLRSI